MAPQTYEEWYRCITVACGIKLDQDFIEYRLTSLENRNDPQTANFIQLYGENHYRNIIGWFRQAKNLVRP